MKHLIRAAIALVLASLFTAAANLFATTCIAQKPIKVQQVCGLVVDHDAVPIPDVPVELIDLRTDLPTVIQTVRTDTKGKFMFSNLPAGEYAVRVRFAGFATASQNLKVGKQKPGTECQRPIKATIEPTGRCSSVSVTRKR